jgi:phosphopantetheine--protein transferase-like protein
VCVAVSRASIGVDVEKIQPLKRDIAEKILSKAERVEYENLSVEDKTAYLIKAWTKKESLFKAQNIHATTFDAFQNLNGEVVQRVIKGSDGEYALAIATSTPDRIRIFDNVKLLENKK